MPSASRDVSQSPHSLHFSQTHIRHSFALKFRFPLRPRHRNLMYVLVDFICCQCQSNCSISDKKMSSTEDMFRAFLAFTAAQGGPGLTAPFSAPSATSASTPTAAAPLSTPTPSVPAPAPAPVLVPYQSVSQGLGHPTPAMLNRTQANGFQSFIGAGAVAMPLNTRHANQTRLTHASTSLPRHPATVPRQRRSRGSAVHAPSIPIGHKPCVGDCLIEGAGSEALSVRLKVVVYPKSEV